MMKCDNFLRWLVKTGITAVLKSARPNSGSPSLDVKPLTNDPEARLRLRVGNYRVKFNRDDGIQIIEIVRVGHRKDIYK